MNYMIKNLFKYQPRTNIKQKNIKNDYNSNNKYIYYKFSFFISVDKKLKTYNDRKLLIISLNLVNVQYILKLFI